MPLSQRAIMACGVLVLVPAAIWAIRGENPFLPPPAAAGGTVTIYGGYADGAHHPLEGISDALRPYFEEGDHTGHGRAHAHPHGDQVCASGCAASNHPTKPLTKAEYHRLVAEFAKGPMTEENEALEHLAYYGRQALLYLDREGPGPLDDARAAFLRRELKRTHVLVRFRVLDEHGEVRVSIPPTRVALDLRYEFKMDTHNLQPLETSGTVKRVGLYHLWQRI